MERVLMETKMIDTSTEFIHQFVETVPEGERIRLCIQCGACSGACPFGFAMDFPPHGMIAMLRAGMLDDMLKSDTAWMCVSCYACTQVCPAKNKKEARLKAINMADQLPLREPERANYNFFLELPEVDRLAVKQHTVKGSAFLEPLFEYSGACAGCARRAAPSRRRISSWMPRSKCGAPLSTPR